MFLTPKNSEKSTLNNQKKHFPKATFYNQQLRHHNKVMLPKKQKEIQFTPQILSSATKNPKWVHQFSKSLINSGDFERFPQFYQTNFNGANINSASSSSVNSLNSNEILTYEQYKNQFYEKKKTKNDPKPRYKKLVPTTISLDMMSSQRDSISNESINIQMRNTTVSNFNHNKKQNVKQSFQTIDNRQSKEKIT